MKSIDPLERTFGQLSVGDKFRIKPTASCPKGQSPVYEKIKPKKDPMYPEDVPFNYRCVSQPSTMGFLYNPTPVILIKEDAMTAT